MNRISRTLSLMVVAAFVIVALAPVSGMASDMSGISLTANPPEAADPETGVPGGSYAQVLVDNPISARAGLPDTIIIEASGGSPYEWEAPIFLDDAWGQSHDGREYLEFTTPTVLNDHTYRVGVTDGAASGTIDIYVRGGERTWFFPEADGLSGKGYADDPFILNLAKGESYQPKFEWDQSKYELMTYSYGCNGGHSLYYADNFGDILATKPAGTYLISYNVILMDIQTEEILPHEAAYWLVNYGNTSSVPSAGVIDTSSSDLTIAEGFVTGVDPGSSQEAFLRSLTVPEGYNLVLAAADGSSLTPGSEPIGTGMQISAVDPSTGDVAETITVVVRHDVMGTGVMSLTQVVATAEAYTGTRVLTEAQLMAVDSDGNGRLTLTDLVQETIAYVTWNAR